MLRAFWLLFVGMLAVAGAGGCGHEPGQHSPQSPPSVTAATETTTAVEMESLRDERAQGYLAHPDPQDAPAKHLPLILAPQEGHGPGLGGDKYAYVAEAEFTRVQDAPRSTFSIDVDTASYAKTRAYLLEQHALPPPDAVRIEELINYFDYSYAGPEGQHPFAIHLETAQCPWQPAHRLVRIGIQGRRLTSERPASNLVFLIDVSGSMAPANKLPLLQRSLTMLVNQLGENDRVAIVVYAGAAGLVLPPTSGSEQATIVQAIERLVAGGSTNGGQGIDLAYRLAEENFIRGGVNRVLLCTDGDFNVGVTSTGALVRLAETRAKAGIYLSILGFGFGNHNDELLEQIAGKANGNHAFIDTLQEARKVLVEQMQGTLVTIAKDVKLQVEFNPATVAAYRLIGYDNRRLADRNFNDDAKDAGDIGAGHSVTALYEIVPPGAASTATATVDPLKYRQPAAADQHATEESREPALAGELLTLKLRYQPPEGGKSTLVTCPLRDSGASFTSASSDLQFAAAVASFGMLLRNSQHKGDASYAAVLETAAGARGDDRRGLRGEFLELVRAAQQLSGERAGIVPAVWQPAPRIYLGPIGTSTPRPHAPFTFFAGMATGIVLILGTIAFVYVLSLAAARTISFACAVPAKKF